MKLHGFFILALFSFAALTDVLAFNEKVIHEKFKDFKEDAKLEYYSNRQFDHPDADPETLQKHGASMEDAKMQADGLSESKVGKKVKEVKSEHLEAKLQEMVQGEEKHGPRRRHHRHEIKVHEDAKSVGTKVEKISAEASKEKKVLKTSKTHQIVESSKSEVKDGGKGDSKPEQVSQSHHGKRTHDKKKKGHKHANSGHKIRKHGGKKHKQSKGNKDKKTKKYNHH